jgi:hypothetical protein
MKTCTTRPAAGPRTRLAHPGPGACLRRARRAPAGHLPRFSGNQRGHGRQLHQRVHEVPGLMDHREPKTAPPTSSTRPSHPVELAAGSVFETMGRRPAGEVNSLHGQGIGRLAPGLRPLAHAPDGLVEAFEVQGAHSLPTRCSGTPSGVLGNPFYTAIFRAFGDAVRQRRVRACRTAPLHPLPTSPERLSRPLWHTGARPAAHIEDGTAAYPESTPKGEHDRPPHLQRPGAPGSTSGA